MIMSVCPIAEEYIYQEHRAIRTKHYTCGRSPDNAIMFFDNLEDPFQMNNLIANSDFEVLLLSWMLNLKRHCKELVMKIFKIGTSI